MDMEMQLLNSIASLGMSASQKPVDRENSAAEFAKIFYREIFRQVFTSSSMGEESPLLPSLNQERFIDTLAEEMVRKNLVPLGIK